MCSTDYTDQDKQIQYGSLSFQSRIKTAQGLVGQVTQVSTLYKHLPRGCTHGSIFTRPLSSNTLFSEGTGAITQCTASMAQFSSTMHCSQNFSCYLLNSLVNKSCLSSLIASDRTLSPLAQSPLRLYSGLVWVIPGRPKSFLGTLLVTTFSSYSQYKQEN